ncbi:MAG: hypothetical protein PQJ50_08565 [Spirochaetales bacterium]|nr:hypothetical protein [Spirochaetales bacterium]
MKKIVIYPILLLMLSGLLFAETTKTVTVVNSLDETIYYLYLSHGDERDWGVDRLGDDLFDAGSTYSFEITYDEADPYYDLMAEDEMEKAYRIESINLDEVDTITVTADDFLPFGGRNPVYRDITFINETGEDIYYLYVSSRDSMYWGEDLLGDDILDEGSSYTISVPVDESYPENDILAEGYSGATYELMDFNFLESDSFTITSDNMSSGGDSYDDYYSDDYDYSDDYSDYGADYEQGYRDGFRDAYREAYSQGYRDAMNDY